MTHITAVRLGLAAAFLAATFVSTVPVGSTEAHAASPTVATVAVVTQKAATPKRWTAMRKAKTQAGKWYRYGSAGPSTYDCSGLVMWAYNKVGLSLPHNTGAMLATNGRSRGAHLVQISKANVGWGDLAFFGTGHVELFGHWSNKARTKGVTFGAHKSRTRIGYRSFNAAYYGPTAYYRVVG